MRVVPAVAGARDLAAARPDARLGDGVHMAEEAAVAQHVVRRRRASHARGRAYGLQADKAALLRNKVAAQLAKQTSDHTSAARERLAWVPAAAGKKCGDDLAVADEECGPELCIRQLRVCGSQLAVCLVSLFCVCVSLVRVVIICLASTHTALVSSPSLTALHLPSM